MMENEQKNVTSRRHGRPRTSDLEKLQDFLEMLNSQHTQARTAEIEQQIQMDVREERLEAQTQEMKNLVARVKSLSATNVHLQTTNMRLVEELQAKEDEIDTLLQREADATKQAHQLQRELQDVVQKVDFEALTRQQMEQQWTEDKLRLVQDTREDVLQDVQHLMDETESKHYVEVSSLKQEIQQLTESSADKLERLAEQMSVIGSLEQQSNQLQCTVEMLKAQAQHQATLWDDEAATAKLKLETEAEHRRSLEQELVRVQQKMWADAAAQRYKADTTLAEEKHQWIQEKNKLMKQITTSQQDLYQKLTQELDEDRKTFAQTQTQLQQHIISLTNQLDAQTNKVEGLQVKVNETENKLLQSRSEMQKEKLKLLDRIDQLHTTQVENEREIQQLQVTIRNLQQEISKLNCSPKRVACTRKHFSGCSCGEYPDDSPLHANHNKIVNNLTTQLGMERTATHNVEVEWQARFKIQQTEHMERMQLHSAARDFECTKLVDKLRERDKCLGIAEATQQSLESKLEALQAEVEGWKATHQTCPSTTISSKKLAAKKMAKWKKHCNKMVRSIQAEHEQQRIAKEVADSKNAAECSITDGSVQRDVQEE